jgi:VWFA-related protein
MPNLARRMSSLAPRFLATTAAACLAITLSAAAQQSPASQPAAGQPYTIQTRVPLTIVDVVVTDSKGHPVHGLQQSDFTLLEDNQPMHPNSFEEHRTDQATPPASSVATPTLPPNAFTNATPTPGTTLPLNILLIDNLNTPTQVQQRVQLEMLSYIKRMPPGTPMAVFGLTTRLFIVQGITTDPELLKTAVASSKNLVPAPPTQDLYQDPTDIEAHSAPMPGDECDETDTARTSERAEYTLSAMRQLARYLSGMPGRKNLIWFGGSFPTEWPPEYMPGAGSCYDYRDALNAATDLLARAHVAINPIESRGLQADNRKRLEEHHDMDLRADQTGGHAVYTSNDLAGTVAAAIDFGSNFYTLTYTPTNQTLDTRFRTIKVSVNRPNLHLTYRNGYFAVAPETDARGKKIDAVTPMQAALMRGALPATQILFRVNVAQSPTPEATAPTSNQPDPKLMHPPYRHYDLAYVIDIHGIDFKTSPDGNYRGDFEYGVRVYNAGGDEIINSTAKTVSPILPPAVYKSMLNSGANAHQEIDVPATGNYFLRIAVHDLASDRVGSIEIPSTSITPIPK